MVAGAAGALELAKPDRIGPHSALVSATERHRPHNGGLLTRTLTAQPTEVDLGGRVVTTSAYDNSVPALPIRITAGDRLHVTVRNQLPDPTTVHWHGLALRNDMDGVPAVTMDPIPAGSRFNYSFTAPDPGTYWFHPHVGTQLDTGLQGALVIEDPHEQGSYDDEIVLVLDDWTDGWSDSPEQILARFRARGMPSMQGMRNMNMMGQVTRRHPLGKDTGDVRYPAHLINGRLARDPQTINSKVGRRLRLRIINAAADTPYRFEVGGHRLTVTHADGYPVQPIDADSLILGMGERYDVTVTARDGAFPIFATPVGKGDAPALAVLRTGNSRLTDRTPRDSSAGRLLGYGDLVTPQDERLGARQPDTELDVELTMGSGGRRWLINGVSFDDYQPLQVERNQRVRLNLINKSMMFHPMHLHGHTFQIARASGDGPRKDTVNVLPMAKLAIDVQTDNPGQWLLHCHNIYHGELGMMTVLSYVQ